MAGPYYFAWADYASGGAFPTFGIEHQVEDEKIVSFTIEHTESNCPTLSIDIRNPKRGLLAPGRPLWAWLSKDMGSAGVVPLFFGRLVGVPSNIFSEVVTLQFIAKPLDFMAQKQAEADTLKVRPGYDPVFIDFNKRKPQVANDADTVLDGYSKLWHTDRVTLAVSASDVLEGEDGTVTFDGNVPYDSVQETIGQPPLPSLQVKGTVQWTQTGSGTVDFGSRTIDCWDGGSIISGWPKTGQQLAGGWSVAQASAIDRDLIEFREAQHLTFHWENREKTHANGDPMSVSASYTLFPADGDLYTSDLLQQPGSIPAEDDDKAQNIPLHMSFNQTLVPFWHVNTTLSLSYEAKLNHSETVTFTLAADLQDIVTLQEDAQESIELPGSDVGLQIDENSSAGGGIPISDLSLGYYFPTERGKWSLEYLISVAVAHLKMRSRCVSISFDCPFDDALELSCRKNAILVDSRIAGGQAQGKIIAYTLRSDGGDGKQAGSEIANVTIGCCIGHGGSISAGAGTPVYVNGVFNDGEVQRYEGDVITLGAVGYSSPAAGTNQLQFPLTRAGVVVAERFEDLTTTLVQVGTIPKNPNLPRGIQPPNPEPRYVGYPITSYYLEILPVTGDAAAVEYDIDVTQLKLPKQIDLESAVTA